MSTDKKKIIDSLDVVGEVFPDVKEAVINGHFKISTTRKETSEQEAKRCIQMYAILKNIEKLSGRKLEVLVYYLIYGYSKQTKDDVIKELKMTDSNLNNINHRLRKMGLINIYGTNFTKNEVSKELIAFKDFIVGSKGEYILIKINKE